MKWVNLAGPDNPDVGGLYATAETMPRSKTIVSFAASLIEARERRCWIVIVMLHLYMQICSDMCKGKSLSIKNHVDMLPML